MVPTLFAVTRTQLSPAGSLGWAGGVLECVGVGDGVALGVADGVGVPLPDSPPDGLPGVGLADWLGTGGAGCPDTRWLRAGLGRAEGCWFPGGLAFLAPGALWR